MKKIALIVVVCLLAAVPAGAVILPLLTNNSFVSGGWRFGVSAFGTGSF